MKKVLLSISLLALFSAQVAAQKANVIKAENLIMQEKPDFKGARESLKSAFEDEKTKNDVRTYYVAGMVGFQENEALVKDLMLGKTIDQDKKGKSIVESCNYFLKAYSLDMQPNEKGKVKPKFTKKIKANVKGYYTEQWNLIAYGAHLFENKKYEAAYDVFSLFLDIPKHPMMNNEISMTDSTYRMIKYYTALTATNMHDSEKAIFRYKDMLNDNYETKNVYQLLAEEYKNKKDTASYLETLEEGFNKFTDDPWFLQNIINHYIFADKINEASSYLDRAIKQAPDIPQYHYVKGNVDERLGKTAEARKAFEKAVELKPDMAESYAGIGRIIFNEAVAIQNAANEIKDNKLYEKEVEKANTIFKESQTYFEKAVELDPKEMDYKQALKMLYYRLGMTEDYERISYEMN